jgi:hypothetical protein
MRARPVRLIGIHRAVRIADRYLTQLSGLYAKQRAIEAVLDKYYPDLGRRKRSTIYAEIMMRMEV